ASVTPVFLRPPSFPRGGSASARRPIGPGARRGRVTRPSAGRVASTAPWLLRLARHDGHLNLGLAPVGLHDVEHDGRPDLLPRDGAIDLVGRRDGLAV